ncbi:hypothetical protein D9542_00695 [Corynebacterium macginleyi]|nr:hypothetical protein D9542_00695 [Corynebacterium macginleyi]
MGWRLWLWDRCFSTYRFGRLQVLHLFWRWSRFFHLGKLRRWLNRSPFRARFRCGFRTRLRFRFWCRTRLGFRFGLRAKFWFRFQCEPGFWAGLRFRFRTIRIRDVFQASHGAFNDEA